MIELEKTYLAKFLPKDLFAVKKKELIDIYIPLSALHPKLRIRKKGDKYEITKKTKLSENDSSRQLEETIPLTGEEFEALSVAPGKKLRKIRYEYPYGGKIAEIDVFQDDLEGLVLIDFEFGTIQEKNDFQIPDFCLVEVTQEEFIAGGMLCGKKYRDIQEDLEKFEYQKLL